MTPAPLGAFVLVLHAHLPWVLGHGRWPHGQSWLFEAASDAWLPQLAVLDRLANDGITANWTVGLTPVLLEQFAAERFRDGMTDWLKDREARAKADVKRLRGHVMADLAEHWRLVFAAQRKHFRSLGRDLARGFVRHANAGRIELLTSNATHAYSPLVRTERCLRAQVRAGLHTSKRARIRAKGAWFPECAYRPSVGKVYADEGVRFFFAEAKNVAAGVPFAVRGPRGRFVKLEKHPIDAGWGSSCDVHRVAEGGHVLNLAVFARCPEVSEQVWSAKHGYPGDPRYLEFHKREGQAGHRYWRVTGSNVDLGGKHLYEPAAAAEAVRDQADHFVRLVRGRMMQHRAMTGRPAVVCAPFDAELFGHWWHEGPAFLEAVARNMHRHPEVAARTASHALAERPPDRAITVAEGSWGDGADHRVWQDDRVRYWWDVQHHAEERLLRAIDSAPWRDDENLRGWLVDAARELLLLQASDWAFVITTRGAVDYGHRRIGEHGARFEALMNAVDDLGAGRVPDAGSLATRALSEAVDTAFPDLDLSWWT